METVLECGKSFDKVRFNVFTDISEHAYKNKLSNLTAETKTDEPILNEPLIDC